MRSEYVFTPDGLRLHVITAGAEDAPPLVLLHGFPASSLLWRKVIPPLAEHFRVYAPDLPGHGQSDKPLRWDYDREFYDKSLLGLFDALGLDQAALACHDIGGVAGLAFTARHPERISRLIVLDTVPYPDIPLRTALMFQMMGWPVVSWLLLRRPVLRWALRSFTVYDKSAISDDVLDLYHLPWVRDAAGQHAFRAIPRVPPRRMIEPAEHYRQITMPTLILWAENDRACPVSDAHRLKKDIPHAELIIVPEAGHFLQEEKPGVVAGHMLKFLGVG